MGSTQELMRRGQLAELRDRRVELIKKFNRCREDVVTYSFARDPLDPIGSCQLDLAVQAINEQVAIEAEYLAVEKAIKELEN